VGLTTSPPSTSCLCRNCWSLDVSHPYGPSRLVTGITLPFYLSYQEWEPEVSEIVSMNCLEPVSGQSLSSYVARYSVGSFPGEPQPI
jgi:hypothetical protein